VERGEAVDAALATLTLAGKAVAADGRDDLTVRLDQARARLEDAAFHVLVVGEFKQGKSTLVNALLGVDVCPVDDDIATAVPTAVQWSERPTAAVLFRPPDADDDAVGDPPDPIREEIPVAEVRRYATENRFGDTDVRRIQSIEVGLPIELLRNGLVIVDTPGVGGLGSAHSTVTMGALPMAEAVLFVSDASQEFTAPEIDFMERARQLCPNLVCVLTKTDFYPAWRKIEEIDRGHLDRLKITTPTLAVSSALHASALEHGDDALDAESGFPALLDHLKTKIVGKAEELTVGAVVGDLHAVIDQLEGHFEERKAALGDPEGAEARVAELEAAKVRADELKSRAARWQQTLSDGGQDLTAEVDHDLRARFRKINQQVDDALEEVDPADVWPEFEPWLYRRVAEDVVYNHQFLLQQSQVLARTVAEHFDLERAHSPIAIAAGDPTTALGQIDVDADLEARKMTAAQQGMAGLRGGYIGTLMFGALGGMLGIALGPLPIGIGLVMGRKSLRDEKARQLAQRRAQAKNVQRRYMDEANFMVNKDSRDALRRINRQLRDHFQVIAEEQSRSVGETLTAIQNAVRGDQNTRKKEQADVDAELKRIADLRKRVEMIGPMAVRKAS
jgi:hypothetical protein